MKKLMIAAAIVCAAALSQAASINWKTGTAVKGVTSATDGTFSGSNIAAPGKLNMYVFILDDVNAYNGFDVSKAYDTYGSKIATADGKMENKTGAAGGTAETIVDAPAGAESTWYAAVLLTYDQDGDGTADWFIGNKAIGTVNSAGQGAGATNLAKNLGGTGGTAITGWTAVPEPTSGLLLLLGVAGLALRRRRA